MTSAALISLTPGLPGALLTGDGSQVDIVEGLKRKKKLDAQGKLHVDVLKVQHHGSENNIDEGFAEAITADQYVFCGNGAHENPDLEVIEVLVRGRLDPEWGHRVVAWVVAADPADPPTLDELRAHAARKIPRHKAPREVVLMDALPRTGAGKPRTAGLPDRE